MVDELNPALFPLPDGTRRPERRIVLVTGPSGSGKTSLMNRLGVPTVALDDFYLDLDHPDMPQRFGIIDWDDPQSWNRSAAIESLLEIVRTGEAPLPIYDIPTSKRTGTQKFVANGAAVVVAEGIFASEIVADLKREQVLADAITIARPRFATFWFRLLRDLGESRKPPLTLLRRGWGLFRMEPQMVAQWDRQGCRKLSRSQAEKRIRELRAKRD